jgi:flavodoxin
MTFKPQGKNLQQGGNMVRRTFIKKGLAGLGVLALPGAVSALNTSFTVKKKWAVLYGSKCGSTKTYAGYINEGMGGIAEVIDIAQTTPNVNDYDYFVIGGWRNGSNLQPPEITTFITTNKAALKDKIRGLFVVLGNGGNATLSEAHTTFLTQKLVEPTGVSNKPKQVLFGKSDPACNGLSVTYDNVKKEPGVAFGKQIVDAATAAFLDGSEKSIRFGLSHSINKFASVATISYTLPRSAAVQVTVHALNGKQVATLVSSRQEAGRQSVDWNTNNLAPGIYLYRLEAANIAESRVLRLTAY